MWTIVLLAQNISQVWDSCPPAIASTTLVDALSFQHCFLFLFLFLLFPFDKKNKSKQTCSIL
jgi:hypothetical protein